MILESFALVKTYDKVKQKENIGGLDSESAASIVFIVIWFLLWVVTLIVAIKAVKSKRLNSQTGVILSALTWPMYWLFKITGVLG